jgi:hypothetical protein
MTSKPLAVMIHVGVACFHHVDDRDIKHQEVAEQP